MKLTIDIETIPSQQTGIMEVIRSTIKPPANISKQETIDKWMAENAESASDERYRKTALDGTLGEIICIGWAINDEPAQSVIRHIGESEAFLLQSFYDFVGCDNDVETIIGHNVLNFDARFLYQRSVINGIKPSFNLRQDERYNGGKCYDTMLAWAGWGNRISLKNLCAALNIPVKQGDITGSNVWDAFQSGRYDEIADYCRQDVSATWEAYKKMTFQGV